MKNQLKELQKQRVEIANKIYEIEQAEIEKNQYPKIKSMLGWCVKSEYNDDKQGHYRKILEVLETKEYGLYFLFEEISINEQGEAKIQTTSDYPYVNKEWWNTEFPMSGWARVSELEYDNFKEKMFKEMNLRTKLRKFITKLK